MVTKIKHTDNWGDFLEIYKCRDGSLLITCTDGAIDESANVNMSLDDFIIIVGQVAAFYRDDK
ncbi:hypothetical protein QCF71_gp70 [Escherichia phage vB_EcoS_fFiEco02]|uniref:hypothetical protein n=1 Tax=Escherichia phage vB_EcoS_fFiEco02 TaxID=2762426 RepID=UPI001860F379|nr:hypothetical protein QCF71_gp70 [Escherichia phage vB_EcoS_fFiEco02]QNO11630.1 hypothetical protein FE2_069 [Escherichia phage vB_EcoS_fFiEco02]